MSEWWGNELYSQFGEDGVLLGYFRAKGYARSGALDDFGSGFYVDVGAHHPYMLSNTWFFYQKGWRGITVDPTPGIKDLFEKVRPRDINLDYAISGKNGEASFFIRQHGVENSLDGCCEAKGRIVKEIKVKTRMLSTVLNDYVPEGLPIDILSVDVEGADLEVLASSDWTRFRPEIVVVESHSSDIWHVIASDVYKYLTERGYVMYGWAQPSILFKARNPIE